MVVYIIGISRQNFVRNAVYQVLLYTLLLSAIYSLWSLSMKIPARWFMLGLIILITGTLKSREPSLAGSERDGRRGDQRSAV